MAAGAQVPVIPLFDTNGNAGAILFWHSGPIAVNVGVTRVEIVMLTEPVVAHCPAVGVNVYVVVPTVDVLITAGDQVPVIPSTEVPGSNVGTAFWQNGPIAAKVGVTGAVMVISIVVTAPH